MPAAQLWPGPKAGATPFPYDTCMQPETHWPGETFASRLCHEPCSNITNTACCSHSAAAQHVITCSLWQQLLRKHRNWNLSKQKEKKKKKEVLACSSCVILTSPFHVIPLMFAVLHLLLVQNHLRYNSRKTSLVATSKHPWLMEISQGWIWWLMCKGQSTVLPEDCCPPHMTFFLTHCYL